MSKKGVFSIEKATEKHGDWYDYSKVEYVDAKTKVKIICPEHGEFEQTPNDHISSGKGCLLCGRKKNTSNRTKTTEEFIKEVSELHNNKYTYGSTIYKTAKIKVKITCPEHGEFEQVPDSHLNGCGCPKCGDLITSEKRIKSNQSFISKCDEIHYNKYDYSKSFYTGCINKVHIICPIHGDFEQVAGYHLNGQGCPKCGITGLSINQRKDISVFISEGNIIHDNKYDYTKSIYINGMTKLKIICPEHGEFEQTPNKHINMKQCCPKCRGQISKRETEVVDYIKSIYSGNVITTDKTILNGKHIDIYLPDINLAIEFDGLYWHNELKKPISYHLNKTKLCKYKGIKLIHIFEDEWIYKKDIVKSMLRNKIGLTANKIFGRKCIIKEVNIKDSREFLDNNHIQGDVSAQIKLGLYYNDNLVSLMCFNEPRKAKSNDFIEFELTRFCNKLNTNVIGAASKLLKYFIDNYKPKNIISYADLRWSTGDLYLTLGFTGVRNGRPNYFYVVNGKRVNKSGFRKSKLIKSGFDSNKSEHEIMLENGIYRIYDCGKIRFELTTKNR